MNKLESLGAYIRAGAEKMGEWFTAADDDWATMAFVDIDGHDTAMLVCDGDVSEFVGDVCVFAKMSRARRIGFVSSVWAVYYKGDEEPTMRPSLDPRRQELVLVSVCDAEVEYSWMAEIKRADQHPPALGEWQASDPNSGARGRMTALQEALR